MDSNSSSNSIPEPNPNSDPVRPVGGTEYSLCQSVPGGTGTTVLALLFTTPTTTILLSSLQNALEKLQNHHPILRAHLTCPTNSHPFFSFPSSSTSPLLTGPDPAPESASDLHSLLELSLNHNPWAQPELESGTSIPVFFVNFYVIAEPERSVLVLRFHTAACDRASAAVILTELMGFMDGASEPDADDVAVKSAIEELIPKRDTWKPFWARGRDLIGYSLNGLRTSTLRFDETEPVPRSTQVVRLVVDRDETKKLLEACKDKGIKLCAAMAAATLLAAHRSKQLESGQQETYLVGTLIDCRKYLEPPLNEHNVGFYHSAVINTHTIHGEEGLWELAKRCHDSYSDAKNSRKHLTDIAALNFLMSKAIENPHLTAYSSLRTAVVSVFEEPVIYESSELQRRLGVEDYVGCASVHGVGPSIAMFDAIRDGQLDCPCAFPSPLHSRKQIQEILEQVKRILVEASSLKDGEMEEESASQV